MACEDKKGWRADILGKYQANRPEIPKWLEVFMSGTPRKMDCGASKAVYVFGNKAISVESGPQDFKKQKVIKERLDLIPKKYQKHFNYYKSEFCWSGYVFRELSLCPKGTLSDLMQGKYKMRDEKLKELILALEEMHKVGLAVSDLKPPNIMLCSCNCLAFIDLDSAVVLPYSGGPLYRTPWWNIDPKSTDEDTLKTSDWISISLVVLFHYSLKKTGPLTSAIVNSMERRNYYALRNLKPETLPTDLARAAHGVVSDYRSYRYTETLPSRERIDVLINVSKRKWWLKF